MKCKRCGAIDFTSFVKRRIICKKCDSHMKTLIYGLVEYSNLLYSIFMKKDIVESDYILETSLLLCNNLSVYEELGLRILDSNFWSQLDMKYHYTKILDLRNKLIEMNEQIKEINVRRYLYNSAEYYEKTYEFEDALIEYLKLHKMYPSHIGPILSIADMYRKLNKLDEGIDFLIRAKETPYYDSVGNKYISYRHNLDKKLIDLEEKYSRGYMYRPRKKK